MDNKTILEQAIQKAVDGGLTGYWADRYKRCEELDEMEYLVAGNIYEEGHSLEELLFNHDFAKALWGEYGSVSEAKYVFKYKKGSGAERTYIYTLASSVSPWQYHLQLMVISPDPIKYLRENI